MTKSGEDKNFYDLIIDLIYKPMFLGYSSRINSTIVASELLDLSPVPVLGCSRISSNNFDNLETA